MTPIESLPAKLRKASDAIAKLPATSMIGTHVQIAVPEAAHIATLLAEAANALAAQPKDGELLALADDMENWSEGLYQGASAVCGFADRLRTLASRRVVDEAGK